MTQIETFGDRRICIAGVGKMFYQDGFPISMAVSRMKQEGVEVSMLHVVQELYRNGFSWKRIEATLQESMDIDIDGSFVIDANKLYIFYCTLGGSREAYEHGRQMIFDYLFGSKEQATNFVKKNYEII